MHKKNFLFPVAPSTFFCVRLVNNIYCGKLKPENKYNLPFDLQKDASKEVLLCSFIFRGLEDIRMTSEPN